MLRYIDFAFPDIVFFELFVAYIDIGACDSGQSQNTFHDIPLKKNDNTN